MVGESVKDRRESGFTYIAALFAVFLVGLGLTVTGMSWSDYNQRENEEDLLAKGMEIMNAIEEYKKDRGVYPKNLEVLLSSSKGLNPKRYLRKIYKDPMSKGGKLDFEVIMGPEKAYVMGVRSSSTEEPFMKVGFPEQLLDFEGASSYSKWEFVVKNKKTSAPVVKDNKAPKT